MDGAYCLKFWVWLWPLYFGTFWPKNFNSVLLNTTNKDLDSP